MIFCWLVFTCDSNPHEILTNSGYMQSSHFAIKSDTQEFEKRTSDNFMFQAHGWFTMAIPTLNWIIREK